MARPGRYFHSSRNTPCGISLGRWSPRYLLFCSIILARRCVSRRHGRNRTPDRKRSHVRDKRARAILRRSVQNGAFKRGCNDAFPLHPPSSRRPRSIPRDARMRIVRAPLRHTHVNTCKHTPRWRCIIYLFTARLSTACGGRSCTLSWKCTFSRSCPRSRLLTCSTSVMRCLYRNQKYTRVTFIRDRALTRGFSSPAMDECYDANIFDLHYHLLLVTYDAWKFIRDKCDYVSTEKSVSYVIFIPVVLINSIRIKIR